MIRAPSPTEASRASFRAAYTRIGETLRTGMDGEPAPPSSPLRRRGRRTTGLDRLAMVTLIRTEHGGLVWHFGPAGRALPGRRGRRGTVRAPDGQTVDSFPIERLEPNKVSWALDRIDGMLNGQRGLRHLGPNRLFDQNAVNPTGRKKRLLIVHGTFSNADGMLKAIDPAFWTWASGAYEEILSFEHGTLGISPTMNAFDLSAAFAAASGPLDVIAHSRGGLVTRWFLEVFGAGGCSPCRAVLVGSPLAGTSLAAPFRFSKTLGLMSTLGDALRTSDPSTAESWVTGVSGLVHVAASFSSSAVLGTAADVAVALVPGLLGQARVGGNVEIERLRRANAKSAPTYYAVTSNFRSADPGWRFWEWFRVKTIAGKAFEAVAAGLFPGDNDLVVDTGSMDELAETRRIVDLLPHPDDQGVHHLNYFAQKTTVDAIQEWLRKA